MLNGGCGEAVSLAMKILTRLGDAYGAKNMLKIRSAHLLGAYHSQHSAGVDIAETFVSMGGHFQALTTVSPLSVEFGRENEFSKYSEEQMKIANAQMKLGVTPIYCCTPYLCGNCPKLGQNVAWGEAPAVAYINSVIGARTNKTTVGVEIASSIAGRVPNYGLHLDENRKGQILVNVKAGPLSLLDYDTISYKVGMLVGDKIPVYEGIPKEVTTDELKHLGAASSSPGAVSLFHVVGVTPEARTREEAFQGGKPEDRLTLDRETLTKTEEDISRPNGDEIDIVCISCPYLSFQELTNLVAHLQGRKVRKNTRFFIQTSSYVREMADRMGLSVTVKASGAEFSTSSCVMLSPLKDWGVENVMTNSSVLCGLIPISHRTGVIYDSLEGCVEKGTERS